MFGFHKRGRSLISVSSMEKSEKTGLFESRQNGGQEEEDVEVQTPRQKRNLTMIYLLFLAEAIMASSLSSQIAILVPSSTGCLSMNTSFLRSILECAYFAGSAMGLFWGSAADRFGRRRVALAGLTGMSSCCISMGFATSFSAFALLRFVAGAVSSATNVSALAMLADHTHGSNSRVKIVARLPVIAVCGSIGPIAAHMWRRAFDGHLCEIFARYPGLSGQIACAGLVFSITVAEVCLLEETFTLARSRESTGDNDCEKAAFLGQSMEDDSEDPLNISIIEALNDDAAAPVPSRISITQLLTAPSVLVLLASFSLLSLHSSAFDVLLPHIGHTASHNGGMGIPCSWLKPITMVVSILAAVRILHVVPFVVKKVGLLTMYRKMSFAFPMLYTIVPLIALLVNTTGASPTISAVVSTLAMLVKTTLAGASQVLVLLLVLSAAPDASSTGTVLGVVSISGLFKALAVGISGIGYYLSEGQSLVILNGSLWAALALIALVGVAVTWRLRETPRVGTDIPEECLVWQDMFDSESYDGSGF